MTEYQAKSNSMLSFELLKDDRIIATLSYKNWFKFSALVEITNGQSFQVEPKGFWGTTIELKDADRLLLKFAMNWKGEIVIQTYFNDRAVDFIFKHRGIFKESFILADQEGEELLVMKPQIKWSKMNHEYQVTTTDIFDKLPRQEILLMTCLHCANYYLSMMMGE